MQEVMKQAINTRTQEEYDALMRYYDKNGTLWWKDRPAASVNYWPEYGEDTCVSFSMYNPNFLGYSGKSFYEKHGYEIIPYTEFAKANIVEGTKCPNCNGEGYTAEHDPSDPHYHGECSGGCPVQVQCEHCMATGVIQEPDYKALYLEGREVIKQLSFAGQITGGVAGKDENLQKAIERAEAFLTKHNTPNN